MNIGSKFGRWTITGPCPPVEYRGRPHPMWMCECDCGTVAAVAQGSLQRGLSKSCGCLRRELSKTHGLIHGKSTTAEYGIWSAMKARCSNPNVKTYARYGGRGIRVCDHWQTFEHFYQDMGDRPSARHTLERRDNNGHYEPANCVWDTRRRQANNRITNHRIEFRGQTLTLVEWSRVLGIARSTIEARLRRGWSTELTLTTPVRR